MCVLVDHSEQKVSEEVLDYLGPGLGKFIDLRDWVCCKTSQCIINKLRLDQECLR